MSFWSLALAFSLAAAPVPSADDVPCVPQVQVLQPELCPALGPGAYAAQLAAARVPDVPPDLPLEALTRHDPVVSFTYARVTTPDAPLFATPEDAAAGVVKDTAGRGFIYVNLLSETRAGDQGIYKIRSGDYIRAADVKPVEPTTFQGLHFYRNPDYTFGWLVANVRPSLIPGAVAPRSRPALRRGTVIQIYGAQRVGAWEWFLIGPNQWVEQRAVSKVNLNPPPEGVTGRWIQVDLYEQTMVAYEDDRLVYATLVSSGLDKWATEPGLFKIWARLKWDGMRGSYEPDGSDYYSLEAVPWVMYYDGQRALHGQYWHDGLGYKRSHGCVNLSPLDARWLYEWAYKGMPVWVYDPSGQTPPGIQGGTGP